MAENKSEKKEGIKVKIPRINPWIIVSAILAIALIATLVWGGKITGRVTQTTPTLTTTEAANKAIDYVNTYILQGQATATLVSVNEDNGLYNMKFTIAGTQYNSYITTDGKFLFPSAIDLTKIPEIPEQQKMVSSCDEAKKEDKATLEAFVVSYCPYGVQMQTILVPVARLLGNDANIIVRYIGSIEDGKISSMHGEQEAIENLRQICIREEQKDKYWDYIECFVNNTDSDKCIVDAKVDKTKLNSCMNDPSKGIEYAKKDFQLQAQYSVTGSPTLILNGDRVNEQGFGGRVPDAIKKVICCGFTTEPSECSETLSASGTTASGNC